MCAMLCAIFDLDRRKPPDVHDDENERLQAAIPDLLAEAGVPRYR